MCKLSVVLVLSLTLCPLLLIRAQGPAPELPAAPITPKVKTACMECHDSGILVQQRLDKATWGKEVDKMAKWGALVEPQDRQAFIDYLSTNFPPDKPPAAPQYTAPSGTTKKAGKSAPKH
jgi:hypothetical protein